MNNKWMVWFMSLSLLGLTACHKNRIAKSTGPSIVETTTVDSTQTEEKKDSVVVAEKVEPVKLNEVQFEYLTAKSKFSVESKKQNFDNTNVNIRMKKDSLIWISITGIGFEVARGLITTDSIFFIDKFHKEYLKFSYADLSKKYNFDLNFSLLQSMIVGNLPFPQGTNDQFSKDGDFFVLSQQTGRVDITNRIAMESKKLSSLQAVETGKDNTFSLQYTDFRAIQDMLFPFASLVVLQVKRPQSEESEETKISLKHAKVELLTQSPGFPFNIPSSYSKKM